MPPPRDSVPWLRTMDRAFDSFRGYQFKRGNKMSEIQDWVLQLGEDAEIPREAIIALYLAALDYFRGMPLAADQRDDYLRQKMAEWLVRAEDEFPE